MAGPPDALTETAEEFDALLDLNLTSGFHLSVATVKVAARGPRRLDHQHLLRRRAWCRPRPSAAPGTPPPRPPSSASTRELAGQWGRRGIRVNALVPGMVRHRDDRRPVQQREVRRMGPPQHDAGPRRAARARSTERCSSWPRTPRATSPGHVLAVDGGWTAR